tara:strand:+ start:8979 stop:9692 length:714 start_codon:yes stop_codon:yes gene_type:complete
MKLLFYFEKYQNAIIGTLLIHVLIFVWLNVQSVSFYVIQPKEKTIATIDYSIEEIQDNLEKEVDLETGQKIEMTNISSNFDQSKPLNQSQKNQLERDVMQELKDFEKEQFNELNKDNPVLMENEEIIKDKKNDNDILNKSAEKMATATAKYFVKDRHMTYQKIPSYLCNASGIVRLDIKLNQKGEITDTKINSKSTTTNNDCLIKNALEYTKKWRFNSDFNQNLRVSGWVEFVYLSQ